MTINKYLTHTITIVQVTMAKGVRNTVEVTNVPAFITSRKGVVGTGSGNFAQSETVIFLKPDQTITRDDEITFDGVTHPVVKIFPARNFQGVHHLEVTLG